MMRGQLPQPPHDFACANTGHPRGAPLKLAQLRLCLIILSCHNTLLKMP